MNKLMLVGNLTSTPEKKAENFYTYGIATNKSYKKDGEWKQITQFHNCTQNSKYDLNFQKGDLVEAEGEVTYKKSDTGRFTNVHIQSIKKLSKSSPEQNMGETDANSNDNSNEFDSDVPF